MPTVKGYNWLANELHPTVIQTETIVPKQYKTSNSKIINGT